MIHIAGHDDTLTIRKYFEADGLGNRTYEVEELRFADGTVWTGANIRGVRLDGTAGDDTLVGADGDDTFDGGAGNDRMEGRNGSDTYLFAPGYGADTVLDDEALTFSESSDAIVFASPITAQEISLGRSGVDLNDLVATYIPTGEQITIERQFLVDGLGHPIDQVEELRFADGTTWSAADIRVMLLAGTAGNDTLVGFYGPDTYVFGRGHGQDTIRDPAISPLLDDGDRVAFAADVAPADIRFSHIGDDLIIDILGTSDRLTIEDQFFTDGLGNRLHEVESFVFADGTTWTVPEIQVMVLQGTPGNDTLVGFSSPDTLDGGAGDDWLEGGDGADVYAFDVGYGHDRIYDLDTALGAQSDVVLLGAGLTVANVHLARVEDDLVIWVPGVTDTLTVQSYFYSDPMGRPYEIEELRFSDATVWHHDDILAIVTGGSADNDTIVGDNAANTLDGGAGDDRLLGAAGGDTYVFAMGYGNDTVLDDPGSGSYSAPDRVLLGPGIETGNIDLGRSGDDLISEIAGTGERLTIEEQFFADGLGNKRFEIESFEFADGTTWTVPEVQLRLLQSTPGDDTLIGFFGADTLDGGAGNYSLDGGNNGDTYIFGRGDGEDTIADHQTYVLFGASDVLSFETGIAPTDIVLSSQPNALYVWIAGSTDRIKIEEGATNSLRRIEEFHFADGTVWNWADISSRFAVATSGADVLTGTGVNDTLNGLSGADTMTGFAGDDIYYVDNAGDVVVEIEGEGVDSVSSTVTYTLPANVERLAFTGLGAPNGTGNSLNNLLEGNASSNRLDGGAGADTLVGGGGNDTYVVDDPGDVVMEQSGGGNGRG